MAIVLKINSVDKSSYLMENTLSINGQLNSIKSASFQLKELASVSTGVVASGKEIIIENNGTRVFGGTVKLVTEEQPFNVDVFYYGVEAYCFGSYLDHHIIAEVYENLTAGDIIKDIIDNHLAAEGFTYTAVEDGPTITKSVFNYISVQQAFNELSELTGYDFFVDCFKDVHFFIRETNVAPFSITDATRNCKTLSITDTHENYRNVQYLRAGQDVTEIQAEFFTGDGKIISFPVAYPIAKAPSIQKGVSPKTVGILGLDTGKDFYWNKNSNFITQDSGGTVLTSADLLIVTYQGLFPIIITAEDTDEIAARAAIENGHGRYESISDDPNIDSLQLAIDKANGLLRKFGEIARKINITTDVDGLEAGQLLPINLTAHGLNDSYLIDSVSAFDEYGVGLRYSVIALSGESFGGWVEFFTKLANVGRKFVIRENEVLILLRVFSDNAALTDSLITSSAAAECEIGTAEIGFSEIC